MMPKYLFEERVEVMTADAQTASNTATNTSARNRRRQNPDLPATANSIERRLRQRWLLRQGNNRESRRGRRTSTGRSAYEELFFPVFYIRKKLETLHFVSGRP